MQRGAAAAASAQCPVRGGFHQGQGRQGQGQGRQGEPEPSRPSPSWPAMASTPPFPLPSQHSHQTGIHDKPTHSRAHTRTRAGAAGVSGGARAGVVIGAAGPEVRRWPAPRDTSGRKMGAGSGGGTAGTALKSEVADINKVVISVSSLRHHGTGTWFPPHDNTKYWLVDEQNHWLKLPGPRLVRGETTAPILERVGVPLEVKE